MLSGRRQPERFFPRSTMNNQPIVEGHGEISSAPIPFRRLRDEAQAWGVKIANGARGSNSQSGILCRTRSARRPRLTIARASSCFSMRTTIARLAPILDLWPCTATNPIPCPTVMATRRMIGISQPLSDLRSVLYRIAALHAPLSKSMQKFRLEVFRNRRIKSDAERLRVRRILPDFRTTPVP